MNEANEMAKIITDNIRQATVCIRDAERVAVEMTEPHKVRIINELIAAEMRLTNTLNDIITGDIKEIPETRVCRNTEIKGVRENDRN